MKFLFFPVPFRFGRQAYNGVGGGFVNKEYFECIKYEDGRFEEALSQLSVHRRHTQLVEIDKNTVENLQEINDRFTRLLLNGQTPDVIRIVVKKEEM